LNEFFHAGEGVGSSLGKEIVQIALAEKCARINWLIDCTEKMEMNFSNKFKPSFVDFLNYKMSAESVKTFSEGGLLKKRDLGEITIKLGTQEHIKEVLDLVIELAVYEKEPEAVVIGEKEMIECAFGPCKCYNFLVAETPTESGPKVVGFTVFFPVYEALEQGIHMEDLYVTPKYRGAGLGTEMMRMLAKFISTNNWDFLRYQVLDWNKGAIALYHKLEGKCLENIKNYRLEKKQML
jgi:GNAT superfamily N-acetyltransferase